MRRVQSAKKFIRDAVTLHSFFHTSAYSCWNDIVSELMSPSSNSVISDQEGMTHDSEENGRIGDWLPCRKEFHIIK